MTDWREVLTPTNRGHRTLEAALKDWNNRRGRKHKNKEIVWFPKPSTSLADMRNKLRVAYDVQEEKRASEDVAYFVENMVAEELARRGAITRPGKNAKDLVDEYKDESGPNKPHLSSFRMQNRLFRFLGWTTRRVEHRNQYAVTRRGAQICMFLGEFPGQIGDLSERDLVIESLVNASVFSVNDGVPQWDTRFKQRIVINLLRCCARNGYITNNELVVTAFALKDERDPDQLKEMIDRLDRLRDAKTAMIGAFEEVSVDPFDSSAVNNAYDGPKVLTSLCRQAGLLERKTIPVNDPGLNGLEDMYQEMHTGKSRIKVPRVVNVISELGKKELAEEEKKKLIWFDEIA